MVRVVLASAVLLTIAAPSPARAEPPVRVVVDPATPASPETPRIETQAATFVPGLLLQLDAANRGERAGFSMHRARLSLDAEVDRLQGLGGFIRIGVGEGDVPSPLLDAVIRFRIVGRGGPSLGELQLGRRKVPVSHEVLLEPADLAFVDRPAATTLAPARDTGLLWHLARERPRRRFSFDLGYWNGEAAGEVPTGGSMTSVRLGLGAGDAGRARAGMDWGVGYAATRDAPSDAGFGAKVVLAVDGEIRWRALTVAAETIASAHERAGSALGFFGRIGWQLVADTLELRARAEMLDEDEVVTHALSFGVTFFYLAPRLRLLVDHTEVIRGDRTNDGRTVTSFLFVI